jgi:hypothetical protein
MLHLLAGGFEAREGLRERFERSRNSGAVHVEGAHYGAVFRLLVVEEPLHLELAVDGMEAAEDEVFVVLFVFRRLQPRLHLFFELVEVDLVAMKQHRVGGRWVFCVLIRSAGAVDLQHKDAAGFADSVLEVYGGRLTTLKKSVNGATSAKVFGAWTEIERVLDGTRGKKESTPPSFLATP